MVSRVTEQLNLRTGDRFILLYGINTSDRFCSNQLISELILVIMYYFGILFDLSQLRVRNVG
ncbi:hypothetical protein U9R62_03620 [Cylindrospermopsis raciborskii DSH]|jgi:hypothetical protein|uniref:hypothetical protein n=1 Tax=Cylindrospermopsis raciborskii TaxID=77022 RepID=UPI002EDB7629